MKAPYKTRRPTTRAPYKTMHEKANSLSSTITNKTQPQTPAAICSTSAQHPNQTSPTQRKTAEPITRASRSQPVQNVQNPNARPAQNKTLLDLICDTTTSLLVESAKLNRLGRYLSSSRHNKH